METRDLLVAASLVLGSGIHDIALANSPPDQARVGIKAMDYRDSQPGADRMRVQALSTQMVLPLGASWSLEASTVVDAISGASPAYYTSPASFASVVDHRKAWDLRVSYYWAGQRLLMGYLRSAESDYLSRGQVLRYSVNTADNNSTFDIGVARASDHINPANAIVENERKSSHEWLLGLTQVLSPQDLLQLQWVRFEGRGYFTDPYKFLDSRPDRKRLDALTVRWNHHMPKQGVTARWHARLADDSFGIRSATLGLDLATTAGQWTLTPGFRFYSQSSAYFFSPPDPSRPALPAFPPGFVLQESRLSFDQRMAAFGALTWGLKLEKKLSDNTSLDFKFERYLQRNPWTLHGATVKGLADFRARIVQVGWSYRFGP